MMFYRSVSLTFILWIYLLNLVLSFLDLFLKLCICSLYLLLNCLAAEPMYDMFLLSYLTIALYITSLVKHVPFTGNSSLILQLHVSFLLFEFLSLFPRTFWLCFVIYLCIHEYDIFNVFLLKILLNMPDIGKCFSASFRSYEEGAIFTNRF